MLAAQKLVNVPVFLVCMFVLTVDASLSSVYRFCFDPCLAPCVESGKTLIVCNKKCETECTAKAYKVAKSQIGGEDKQFKEEEKELKDFKKQQKKELKALGKEVKEFKDKQCKGVMDKQCKDEDKLCKEKQKICKDGGKQLKDEEKQ
ncbi:PREDICTED: chromatin assembly factor 1 subunit A-like [Ipomoea nil]|uniref:chromatin assembly factor 1 subunit A-like n=1 Tax=Ipomoea nil TaxID=35883 RepID=UPI0009013EA3|nr:PREDICTED: chromatin assembly factor 1 subunit A-like [Ipomoea nil]